MAQDASTQAPDAEPKQRKSSHIVLERSFTINRPIHEVYRFWRNFESLPQYMDHVESVTVLDDRRSHWVLKTPLPTALEWDAEITDERENELIAWHSSPDSSLENRGSVRFKELSYGRGTEVKVTVAYNPPGGIVGDAVAKLGEGATAALFEEELRDLKRILEAGEKPTIQGQPRGGQ
jgi:uncharacterized membrane protein